MMRYVGSFRARLARGMVVLSLLAAGCSLQQREGTSRVFLEIEGKGKIGGGAGGAARANGAPETLRANGAPETIDGFDCIAINVSGEGISPIAYGSGGCNDFGVTSNLVSLADGGSIDLEVPAGAQRKIQLVGIRLPSGAGACSAQGTLEAVHAKHGNPALARVIEIGSTTADLYRDTAVDVSSAYSKASSKLALACAVADAPVIKSVSPAYAPSGSGARITIAGAGFDAESVVRIGTASCPVSSASETAITCQAGASAAGKAEVSVANPDGKQGSLPGGLTYYDALAVSPTSATASPSGSVTFTASGGAAPVSFSLSSGSGSVSAAGVFTAPTSAGTSVVKASDAAGNAVSATVTVASALAISPGSATLAPGGSVTFTASGGVSPIAFSVPTGSGAVTSGGVFTAGTAAGTSQVTATDAAGSTASATVTTAATLAASPSARTMAISASASFTVSGGLAPYSASVASGGGSIVAGAASERFSFSAPSTAGSSTLRFTDSLGSSASVSVSIVSRPSFSASSVTVAVGNSMNLGGSGGSGALSYSISSGGGSVSASGIFTAPSTAGTSVVTVTDADGNAASATVTVSGALQISPTAVTTRVGGSVTFSTSGGVPPITYSAVSASGVSGTISSAGVYVATSSPGSDSVRALDSLGNTSSSSVSIATSATLDTSFGLSGRASFVVNSGYSSYLKSIAVQSDGKILLAGYAPFQSSGLNQIAVIRTSADGVLDTSFGTSGVAHISIASSGSMANALAVQSDGKIVLAGESTAGTYAQMFAARLSTSGALDTTFATTGVKAVTFSGTAPSRANSVVIDSYGGIYLGGEAPAAGGLVNFGLAKLTSFGILDSAFGSGGMTTTNLGTPAASSLVRSLKISQTDAYVFAAGQANNGADFAVAKFLGTTAALATAFGDSGYSVVNFGSSSELAYAMAQDSSGKIVLAGKKDSDFLVARLALSGTTDTTFGTGGKTAIDFGNTMTEYAKAVAVQGDDKILVAGLGSGTSSMTQVCLARLSTDGSLDTSFGASGTGKACFDIGSGADTAESILISPPTDPRILVGGQFQNSLNEFGIMRLWP